MQQLADFASTSHPLPDRTATSVKRALLDLVAASIAGADEAAFIAASRAAPAIWGQGQGRVWFGGPRTSESGAAFCNAVSASVHDLDDGHRAAAGHPGAAIIPAVLGTEESYPSRSTVVAIAIGYEIAIRVSASRDFSSLPTMASGLWVGQGVAAALGYLKGLPAPQIANAIAFAGISAPNQLPLSYTSMMGTHAKEGVPWATAVGFAAVELARAGFTAPTDLFDKTYYSSNILCDGLGKQWNIESVYFKPYGCCRWSHAAIDGVLALMASHDIRPEDISKIEIDTFSRALRLNNASNPSSLQAAQYSIPFCVALAAVFGSDSLLPITNDKLGRSDVVRLASQVSLFVDPELDRMFSSAVPARVRMKTQKGELSQLVLSPRGEADNPLDLDILRKKFLVLSKDKLEASRQRDLFTAIEHAVEDNGKSLKSSLTRPLDQLRATGY